MTVQPFAGGRSEHDQPLARLRPRATRGWEGLSGRAVVATRRPQGGHRAGRVASRRGPQPRAEEMVLPRSSAVGGVSPPLLRRAGRTPAVLAAAGASRRGWDRDPALQLTRPGAQQRGRSARLPPVPPMRSGTTSNEDAAGGAGPRASGAGAAHRSRLQRPTVYGGGATT